MKFTLVEVCQMDAGDEEASSRATMIMDGREPPADRWRTVVSGQWPVVGTYGRARLACSRTEIDRKGSKNQLHQSGKLRASKYGSTYACLPIGRLVEQQAASQSSEAAEHRDHRVVGVRCVPGS